MLHELKHVYFSCFRRDIVKTSWYHVTIHFLAIEIRDCLGFCSYEKCFDVQPFGCIFIKCIMGLSEMFLALIHILNGPFSVARPRAGCPGCESERSSPGACPGNYSHVGETDRPPNHRSPLLSGPGWGCRSSQGTFLPGGHTERVVRREGRVKGRQEHFLTKGAACKGPPRWEKAPCDWGRK